MGALEERKKIERFIIRVICSDDRIEVYSIPRKNGRILSYSPYEFRNRTNSELDTEVHYKYNNLSRLIHLDEADERNKVEDEIFNIIPHWRGLYLTFETFGIIADSYERYVEESRYHKFPLVSKQTYNRIRKLIRKWQCLSASSHYKLTKQEKRKIKKMYNSD